MTDTLVDANVLIDVWSADADWAGWSTDALALARLDGELVINPLIFAEVCVSFASLDQAEGAMARRLFRRDHLPWEAAFLAAKAFVRYRAAGGNRRSPLPDFYIGAHAELGGLRLLTRDTTRYRIYFPQVELISPETHP
jgi:predicted nucleic acid-binding protein